ncbi:hypothetical protein JTB14_000996 [Gonioctena quinquepunctata]|nr:hypothetical protein JTB14_000996 [Gonioctena quinquepunctata]
MSPTTAQEHFSSNNDNKSRLINLLRKKKAECCMASCKAEDDADRSNNHYIPWQMTGLLWQVCRPPSPLSWFTGSFERVFSKTWTTKQNTQQAVPYKHHPSIITWLKTYFSCIRV